MTITRIPRVLAAAAIALFAAVPAAADLSRDTEPVVAIARAPYLEGAPAPIALLVIGSLMIALTLGRKAARARDAR